MYANPGAERGRQYWTSRGISLVAIVLLHVGLLVLALLQRVVRPEPVPDVISVSLLTPDPVMEPQRAPALATARLEVRQVESVVPLLALPVETMVAVSEDVPPKPVEVGLASPVAAAEPASVAMAAPLQVSRAEFTRPPVVIYPPQARIARREGSVGLRVLVAEDGSVLAVEVVSSSGSVLLDNAALEALRAARFKPYLLNGVARRVEIRIPIDFNLKGARPG